MKSLVWIVVVVATIEGGWLCFDGCRALVVGDYVTPTSGEYAGQLGPWANLISSVGIEPRSPLMKWVHVILGVAKLTFVFCFALKLKWARRGLMICALLGLWYLPVGTLLSLTQLGLLRVPSIRNRQ